MCAAFAAGILILLFILNKSYPLDYIDGKLIVDPKAMMKDSFICTGFLFGIMAGWVLERHFIKFEIPETNMGKVERYLPGALMIVFLVKVLPSAASLWLGANWGSFAAWIFIMLFCVAGYPWFFTRKTRKQMSELK